MLSLPLTGHKISIKSGMEGKGTGRDGTEETRKDGGGKRMSGDARSYGLHPVLSFRGVHFVGSGSGGSGDIRPQT